MQKKTSTDKIILDIHFLPTLPSYPISLDILEFKFAIREGVKNIERGGVPHFRGVLSLISVSREA